MLIYIIIMTDTLKNKMIMTLPVELTRNIIIYNLIKTSRKIILRRIFNNLKTYYINTNPSLKCEICRKNPIYFNNIINYPYPYLIEYKDGGTTTDNPVCFKCNNILELNEKFMGYARIKKEYVVCEDTYINYGDEHYDEYLDEEAMCFYEGEEVFFKYVNDILENNP